MQGYNTKTLDFPLTHLVELELKAQYMAEGDWLTHVGLDEGQKELILFRPALIHLQDDVQNPIRVQIEAAYGENKEMEEEDNQRLR